MVRAVLAILATVLLACGGEDPQLTPDQCPVYSPPHGAYLLGTCHISCAPGYRDCDGEPVNGCEAYMYEDGNCGACGRTCQTGYTCTTPEGSLYDYQCIWIPH